MICQLNYLLSATKY